MEVVAYDLIDQKRGAWFGPYRVRRYNGEEFWYVPTDRNNRVGVLSSQARSIEAQVHALFDTPILTPIVLGLMDANVGLHAYYSSRHANGHSPYILTLSLEAPTKSLYVVQKSFLPFDVAL